MCAPLIVTFVLVCAPLTVTLVLVCAPLIVTFVLVCAPLIVTFVLVCESRTNLLLCAMDGHMFARTCAVCWQVTCSRTCYYTLELRTKESWTLTHLRCALSGHVLKHISSYAHGCSPADTNLDCALSFACSHTPVLAGCLLEDVCQARGGRCCQKEW